ncbi:MAG: DUF4340 domain-containing protein [Christensenellaceae bacterium]|nr:DUF4340 domain-containing protein [Christensenellaceae bacterium]
MQNVRRRQSRPKRHGRLFLLLAAVALLLLTAAILWLGRREEPQPTPGRESTAQVLMTHEADEVEHVAVTLRNGEGWTVLQTGPGALTMADDPDFEIDAGYAALILGAARTVSCAEVLTDDPALYLDDLASFGLDAPRLIADIAYADGTAVTFRVGDALSSDDASLLYMTVDGDNRLFAVERGNIDDLTIDRALLRKVTQPVLHAARFDRVTLAGPDGLIGEWALEGSIGNADAVDRWRLVAPVNYPADANAMSSLRESLATLRLGAYVGPATEENLTACGFDEPRLVISIHQAGGSIGTTSATGEYSLTDWPESSFTLTVGGPKSEDVDYVLYEDYIYISSHYLLAAFMEKNPADTLSRYITPTALGNLARLTVKTDGGTDEYIITRTEQVAENNELVTDLNGSVVFDYACTFNGEAIDYAAFEASYSQLIVITVSGVLPAGWSANEEPHTVYTFHDVSGDTHTVAFITFDALHDAVVIDGEAAFYLIKGGYGF